MQIVIKVERNRRQLWSIVKRTKLVKSTRIYFVVSRVEIIFVSTFVQIRKETNDDNSNSLPVSEIYTVTGTKNYYYYYNIIIL